MDCLYGLVSFKQAAIPGLLGSFPGQAERPKEVVITSATAVGSTRGHSDLFSMCFQWYNCGKN